MVYLRRKGPLPPRGMDQLKRLEGTDSIETQQLYYIKQNWTSGQSPLRNTGAKGSRFMRCKVESWNDTESRKDQAEMALQA